MSFPRDSEIKVKMHILFKEGRGKHNSQRWKNGKTRNFFNTIFLLYFEGTRNLFFSPKRNSNVTLQPLQTKPKKGEEEETFFSRLPIDALWPKVAKRRTTATKEVSAERRRQRGEQSDKRHNRSLYSVLFSLMLLQMFVKGQRELYGL